MRVIDAVLGTAANTADLSITAAPVYWPWIDSTFRADIISSSVNEREWMGTRTAA